MRVIPEESSAVARVLGGHLLQFVINDGFMVRFRWPDWDVVKIWNGFGLQNLFVYFLCQFTP